jgi:DNA-binding MarR family transcriptional regulator
MTQGAARNGKSEYAAGSSDEAPSYPRPFYLITQLNLEILRRLERDMRPTGLTPAVGRVLNAIATRPHISSSGLARMFGIAPQSIKQSIQLLEDRGLIVRTTSGDDQRVLGAEITEAGRKVRDGQRAALDAMYKDVFSGLDQDEFAQLAQLLVKVLRHARPSALEYYADLANDRSPQISRQKPKRRLLSRQT